MDLRASFYALPLCTRGALVASSTSFVLSPFFPATLQALACSPWHVLHRLQLWRLLTSLLCPDTLLSTLMGLFLLYRHAPTMEQVRGIKPRGVVPGQRARPQVVG
jgi:hypothetical protein